MQVITLYWKPLFKGLDPNKGLPVRRHFPFGLSLKLVDAYGPQVLYVWVA